jgi:dTDP-4-dehydrorhamnose reductase
VKNDILILGDGLLRSEIIKQTDWDYVSRKKDNVDLDEILSIVASNDKSIIVNCIANTDTYSNDKQSHMDVNFKFVVDLVQICNQFDKKYIHISTDYVYSNSIVSATEDDVPVHNPTWYSYSKILADCYVENFSQNHTTFRVTHKPRPFPYEKAWDNQFGNFDYVDNQARRIISLILRNVNGIYNIGVDNPRSVFTMAVETNKDVNGVGAPHEVPKNLIMSVSKIKELLNESN